VKFKKRNSKVIGRVSKKKKKKYRHILVKMGPKFKNYDKTLKVTSCKMYNNDIIRYNLHSVLTLRIKLFATEWGHF
jgi:hypothetical protein